MIQFGLYKAVPGTISHVIGWFTRSVYSHVAIKIFDKVCHDETDKLVYEAVEEGFVKSADWGSRHEKGTIVDVLEFKESVTLSEELKAATCGDNMLGSGYDYLMVVAGFPLRLKFEPKSSRKRFDCSEAAFLMAAAMGENRLLLERCQAYEMAPEDINRSPLLKWVQSITL